MSCKQSHSGLELVIASLRLSRTLSVPYHGDGQGPLPAPSAWVPGKSHRFQLWERGARLHARERFNCYRCKERTFNWENCEALPWSSKPKVPIVWILESGESGFMHHILLPEGGWYSGGDVEGESCRHGFKSQLYH